MLACHYAAEGGWLFGLTAQGAKLVAALGNAPIEDALWSNVDQYLAAELREKVMVTLTRHDELAAIGCAQVWPAEGECVLAPVLLRARHCTRALTCGLALLRTREPLRPAPAADLLDALGQALLCDAAISGVSEAG